MKQTKQWRSGAKVKLSVSVDPVTKRALRKLADKQYGGNLSALITDLANEARRRLSAGAYLERRSIPGFSGNELTELEGKIAAEVAAVGRPRRGFGGESESPA